VADGERRRIRVFLIDDHPIVREGVRSYLTAHSIAVVGEASNDKEALRKLKKLTPDVIVVDVSLPSIDGGDLTRRLRRGTEKMVPVCVEGSWGTEFYQVQPTPADRVVIKHRYSAFIGTDLDLILRSQSIQTVILTGVGTHVCVESTARDGFQMDYDIVLLSDCTGSCPPESHNRALEVLGQHFAHVVTSKEILEAWGKG